ncbi:uncharacterized protein RVIR1_10470 [Candidatus Rickettsiella viridis]|uniref:Uncharacterized protein n=1 Tax=Candidatus Rickettsiella viridis TaxID=676208 RepID=A0A2Z5UTL3_9COXI|nr:hypothetical protein [Candidatus Rickettsiella viridis]BBB14788.1 uncharacterized protein RVIR1_02570 [Candidatus Rickettsiella viridis]BBB15518.1 uncharacterized protein RVIR1_10470 [Candidatus Rickettsiella viridis]
MRDYSKLSPHFWINEQGKQIKQFGGATQLIALYLISNPHCTMLGIYYLPMPFIAHELGITLEGALKGLQNLCEVGFCTYDAASEYVWVHDMALSQLGQALKPNDNRVKCINELYQALPKLPFLDKFYEAYHISLCLDKKTKGLIRPYEGTSKSLLSQEQEQEQEQKKEQKQEEDQEQDVDGGAPSDDGLPSSNSELKNPPVKQLLDVIDDKVVSIATTVTSIGLYQIPLSDGSQFMVLPTSITHWQKTYPAVDVAQELRQIQAWNEANPTERKSRTQILRHINTWLAKEQRAASQQRQQSPPFEHHLDLARRGLSPTLAHNLIVGERWLKQSMAKEETLHPLSDAQEILC